MTMPDERTRALLWAREFLETIQRSDLWPTVPDELRRQAHSILRHYPIHSQLDHFHMLAPELFGAVPKEPL